MRKILLTISALALPLAACAQEEATPPEADPIVQEVEEPAMDPEGEVTEVEAPITEPMEGAETSTDEETAPETKTTE